MGFWAQKQDINPRVVMGISTHTHQIEHHTPNTLVMDNRVLMAPMDLDIIQVGVPEGRIQTRAITDDIELFSLHFFIILIGFRCFYGILRD